MTPNRGKPGRLEPALLKLAGTVLVGAVAIQLDATIINVAIDTLGRELHAGLTTIQWVSTAYLLALAMVIPLSGWSIDRFGSKRMWMLALALFLAGSVLSGIAWSAGSLIAFRVVQGIGGGLLLPAGRTILAQAAGPRRLGRLMAAIAVPFALAPVLGPVIGGMIVDSLSWRWIFFINVPVCALALLLAWRGMPDTRAAGRHPLDFLGLALLSPALAAIVYGFSEAGNGGGFGGRDVIVPLALGVGLLVVFAVRSLRSRIAPIIDLRLFRVRSFTASAGLMFLLGFSLFGALLLLPLYYQQARGLSPLDAGLLLAPQGIGMMVALPVVGRLIDRIVRDRDHRGDPPAPSLEPRWWPGRARHRVRSHLLVGGRLHRARADPRPVPARRQVRALGRVRRRRADPAERRGGAIQRLIRTRGGKRNAALPNRD